MCLYLSHEAKLASPRYFATYSCSFLTPPGLSAKRIPDATATFEFSRAFRILYHQSRARSKSCSKLMNHSDSTCFSAVFAPSLMPLPSLKTTVQPKDYTIFLVSSVLLSSTIIFSFTNRPGITSPILFKTKGRVCAPFLVHITTSTFSKKPELLNIHVVQTCTCHGCFSLTSSSHRMCLKLFCNERKERCFSKRLALTEKSVNELDCEAPNHCLFPFFGSSLPEIRDDLVETLINRDFWCPA